MRSAVIALHTTSRQLISFTRTPSCLLYSYTKDHYRPRFLFALATLVVGIKLLFLLILKTIDPCKLALEKSRQKPTTKVPM